VDDDKKDAGRQAIKRLVRFVREDAETARRSDSDSELITKGDLREILGLALKDHQLANRTPIAPPQHRSWAAVIAQASSSDSA
jgi:hypothetical protein